MKRVEFKVRNAKKPRDPSCPIPLGRVGKLIKAQIDHAKSVRPSKRSSAIYIVKDCSRSSTLENEREGKSSGQ